MKNRTQYLKKTMTAYSNTIGESAVALRVKDSLRYYRADEAMRKGYEVMAQINLDFCEFGLVDCLTSISIFEENLNGDDN